MPSYPGFLGPANEGQSYSADNELLINWYLERNESPGAPTPFAMLPCPGMETFASVGQAPIRGEFYQRGRGFFVAGYAFYEVDEGGTTTQWGTVEADANPVTICANGDAGNQLWVTSGSVGYVFDLATNTLSVQGVASTTVTMGGFLSGRFLYLDANTGTLYASAIYDGTSWSAALFAQSESGDPWRAMVVTPDGLIHLLGETTGEVWADQGTSPFPFSKVLEGSIPFGISAPFAWSVDTSITWLAQNAQGRGVILRKQGYQPQRLSTHAIESTIHSYSTLADATAFGYQEGGHNFTTFTFPTGGQSWCFDEASRLWHERAYWDVGVGAFTAYRPCCMMEAFSKTIVGDRLTGTLYQMESSFYTDVDGAMLRRVRQPPRFALEQKRVTVDSIELVMDKGVGLVSGQGRDPQLMLTISKNGGKTFGNERWASAGPLGAFDTRVVWDRCGQARNFTPRIVASDPVPWRIVDCVIAFREGAH